MIKKSLTKEKIRQEAQRLGAELVGFAPINRWEEYRDLGENFYPHQVWPLTKTVISLFIPSLLPVVETKISHLYKSQYNNTNSLLDEIAYRLTAFLNRNGQAAINICRDGYGVGVLQEKPVAAFSHVWAGYYAGLGTVGWNHTLLTQEYGPRVQLVSIFTSLELTGDPLVTEDLCNKCLYCQKICPVQALIGDEKKYAQVDQLACLNNEKRLQQAFSDPCGSCIKVCPVGEDRQLFESNNFIKYFEEQDVLAHNPMAEVYRDWVHIRSYGSYSLDENPNKK